ncbi:hypothetical protein EPI10_024079 [Gossypium australe]|uniref:Uncharacterized protein n=1 Tax=Gossypium australe TaxID=47621 RepID=A0A5B6VWU1_9ROSI|nr:hypothetical protein EPI10_024079 [Gossypium australe]
MPIAIADFSLSLKSRNCYPHQSHSRILLRVQARVPSNSSVRAVEIKILIPLISYCRNFEEIFWDLLSVDYKEGEVLFPKVHHRPRVP